jgi:hypothetical protein
MPEYDSFLLRVWRCRRHEGWEWALRLEHLQGGIRHEFDDPAALVEALWSLVEAEQTTGPGPPKTSIQEERKQRGRMISEKHDRTG